MEITVDPKYGDNRLLLKGDLDASASAELIKRVKRIAKRHDEIILDAQALSHADSFGTATLAECLAITRKQQCQLVLENPNQALKDALAQIPEPQVETTPKSTFFLERWGDGMFRVFEAFVAFMQLCADTLYWVLIAPLRRRFPPSGSISTQAIQMGLDAGPIVMLVGFLMGLIMAFQAAYQLRQFGANIFVANLVGVSMVRELGPLMTAIIVAGRSGSAIAAELGTMTVGEEIDALKTMGIDPIRFLVAPRIYAITFTQPALSLYAMAMGIFGGFLIAIFFLDLSATAYIKQTISALNLGDLMTGLIKSVCFAWVIAIIGVHTGLRIKGGAVGVGRATTLSVVASIFSIIIVDSIFTTLGTIL